MNTLNTNSLTTIALCALSKADAELIGTRNYIGIAWFWNYAFRHYLRDASFYTRRKIHNAFLADGLDIDGVSDRHWETVRKITRKH